MLTPHAAVLANLADAEQGEGWMARCASVNRYLALSAQFVSSLATALRACGNFTVVELCAGDGALAMELKRRGVDVIATDAHPPAGALHVEQLTGAEALRRYRPHVVLGSFVPVDAGVNRQVLESHFVQDYVVLNARLGGVYGSSSLWTECRWSRTRLAAVDRWMVTRHDAWLGAGVPTLCHGEAWHLHQPATSDRPSPSSHVADGFARRSGQSVMT